MRHDMDIKCKPGTKVYFLGLRMSTVDTYTKMKTQYPDNVEKLEDCDWTTFNFGDV